MTIFLKRFKRFISRILKKDTLNEQVSRAVFLAVSLNIAFGILFYLAEHNAQRDLSLFDSIWWSMVTMTTVGYGDIAARTFAGRFFVSYPCMLIGIGIIGYLVGIAAENVIENADKKRKGLMTIKYENHLIICNFPGIEKVDKVVSELRAFPEYEDSAFVLVTDRFDELPDNLKRIGVTFVKGSPTNEDILMRANITKCAGVFILAADPDNINSDEKSFAVGAIIEMIEREQNISIKTIVDMVSKDNLKMIRRSNVDGIVSTDGITGCLLVQEFLYPGINNIIQQLISNTVGSQFYILDTKLEGRRVSEVQVAVLNNPENLQIIGIIKGGRQILNPPKTMMIEKGDQLIMLAENRKDFETIENDILKRG